MQSEQFRRPLTPEDQEKVRFWADALLKGVNQEQAAHQLFNIGVRTRGAVRTRGSITHAAPSRFPQGTDTPRILELLQKSSSASLRSAVAAALAEMGGKEAIPTLKELVVGQNRDPEPGVRAAALDALGIIGGPEALEVLEQVKARDEDSSVQGVASALIADMAKSNSGEEVKQ